MHKIQLIILVKSKRVSKSFIGFLVASILIWFLITLSKNYVTNLTFSTSYINIPQNKLLQKEPIKELDAIVETSGFNILSSRFSKKSIVLDAKDLNEKSAKYFFLTRNLINNIQKQVPSGIQIKEFVKDTIHLDLGSLASKKVAVIPNLEINYHIGYDASELIKLNPDSVTISGPDSQIKQIEQINLELLKLDDVKSSFSKKVKIIMPNNSNGIKVDSSFVLIKGEVEKFTEGTFEVPFKVINLPKEIELTTLNRTVEVVFIVGLSNFNKIDKNFFEVVCDYNLSKENNLNYLLPKVVIKSNLIKSFKVIPNKIDFLIQK